MTRAAHFRPRDRCPDCQQAFSETERRYRWLYEDRCLTCHQMRQKHQAERQLSERGLAIRYAGD
jgi:Zn finger protein HypA/HybF involved in hydrogenase expression